TRFIDRSRCPSIEHLDIPCMCYINKLTVDQHWYCSAPHGFSCRRNPGIIKASDITVIEEMVAMSEITLRIRAFLIAKLQRIGGIPDERDSSRCFLGRLERPASKSVTDPCVEPQHIKILDRMISPVE